MKLTELKDSINEALKLHDDYDIRILTDEVHVEIEAVRSGIDSGRFCFNIYVNTVVWPCERYHVEDDDMMECCSHHDLYHLDTEKCPACQLMYIKQKLKKLVWL